MAKHPIKKESALEMFKGMPTIQKGDATTEEVTQTEERPQARKTSPRQNSLDPATEQRIVEEGKAILQAAPVIRIDKDTLEIDKGIIDEAEATPKLAGKAALYAAALDKYEKVQVGGKTFLTSELSDEGKMAEYVQAMEEAEQNGEKPVYVRKPLKFENRYHSDYDEAYVRQTYYLSYEEIAALEKISYEDHCRKSDLVRKLIDAALEEYYPGVLESVKEEANMRRKETYERMKSKLGL